MRLGYACTNMTLTNRPKKLGGRITTSRTLRQASWQPTWDLHRVGELAVANATDLLEYLKWNDEHRITLFRVGSEIVPWHDHFELTDLPQYDELSEALFKAGDYARKHGHRLTTHPGPFHVLGSPKQDIVERSITSLERHSQVFDLMGFDPSYDNKINIHIGGAYGNHEGTAVRWIEAYNRLSDACRSRLVIENDDKNSMYSVRMLYDLFHRVVGMPITFDYHHHMFHPDGLNEYEALQMAADTWPSDVRQCTHYSECRTHEKQRDFLKTLNEHNVNMEDIENWPTLFERKQRIDKIRKQAHSDFIYDEIRTYGMDFDIVVEAKAKELAVLHYRHIYPKSETKVYNERQRKHTETA